MNKPPKFTEERYITEIETWRKSSKIHADYAIAQYQRVTEGLEEIYFEKARNDAILSALSDGVIVFDTDDKVVICNKVAEKLLCISAKKSLGKNIDELLKGSHRDILSFMRKRKMTVKKSHKRRIIANSGHYIRCCLDKIQVRNKHYWLLLMEDSTDLIKTQHALTKEKETLEHRVNERTAELKIEIHAKELAKMEAEKVSHTDTLTGLPNRRAFTEVLEQTVKHCKESGHHGFSLLFIDLDGFKVINDTLGHFAGDVLLVEIAKRMQRLVRSNDFCSRLGGDEFVIMLDNLHGKDSVLNIVQKLLLAILKPIDFSRGQAMNISASIGVYLHTNYDNKPSAILTMADEAMYEAKARGKNGYVFFDDELHRRLQNTTDLIKKLEFALANREFMVYYQPICNIHGEIVGAEALARWQHGSEMISPAEFIPLLEQRGHIKQFTHFVIEEVVISLLLHENFPCVSVNLSMQQFYNEDFIDYIDEVFENLPHLKSRLNFEITESLFHKDPQMVIAGIKKLRARGFRIYIDDFGTGYSSFAYIRNFKADVIKIDREFVIGIEKDKKNTDLLKGMVALLLSVGMDVVIEGVENEPQISLIRTFGDEVKIQGFYFYKPMPLHDLLILIKQKKMADKGGGNCMESSRNDVFQSPRVVKNSLLDDVFSRLQTYVCALSLDGDILFMNKAILNILGTPLIEMVGAKFYDATWWRHSGESVSSIQADIEVCASGKSITRDIPFLMVSGDSILIEYRLYPVYEENGHIKYLISEARQCQQKRISF